MVTVLFLPDKTPWYPPGGGTTAGWNSTQFKFGQWHHLFCVYDGSKLYAYVDGVKTGTSTINVTGKTSDPYNDFIFGINYQGKIAKLKIVRKRLILIHRLTLFTKVLKYFLLPLLPNSHRHPNLFIFHCLSLYFKDLLLQRTTPHSYKKLRWIPGLQQN